MKLLNDEMRLPFFAMTLVFMSSVSYALEQYSYIELSGFEVGRLGVFERPLNKMKVELQSEDNGVPLWKVSATSEISVTDSGCKKEEFALCLKQIALSVPYSKFKVGSKWVSDGYLYSVGEPVSLSLAGMNIYVLPVSAKVDDCDAAACGYRMFYISPERGLIAFTLFNADTEASTIWISESMDGFGSRKK